MTSTRHPRRGTPALRAAAGAAVAVLVLAGCGGTEDTGATAATDSSRSTEPDAPGGEVLELSEEFRACLEEQGVELPTAPPGSAGEGGGAGEPGGMPSLDPDAQDALTACAELAPGDLPGAAGDEGVDQSALDAFAGCMADNGVEVEASLEAITALDAGDRRVARALETCQALVRD